MFAIILDEENYIKSYSDKFRTPESVLVDSIPDESDPEKFKCYQYIDGDFVFNNDKWAEIEAKAQEKAEAEAKAQEEAEAEREAMAELEEIRRQISDLKATLEQSDYKIIKCQEYAFIGLELPYDVEALHAERQSLRDQINELEKTIQD